MRKGIVLAGLLAAMAAAPIASGREMSAEAQTNNPLADMVAFNLETNSYHVPIGLGIGKVMPSASGKTVYNFFIEPQIAILDRGPGQPEFQIYMALNMQFR